MPLLTEGFLHIQPDQIVANDIFWSLLIPVLLEQSTMTLKNLFTCQEFYHKTWQLLIKEALESPELEMPFGKLPTYVLTSSHSTVSSQMHLLK